MANCFGYSCPKCGHDDRVDIEARIWVRLTRDGTDYSDAYDHNHEWDKNSKAACQFCGWEGYVCLLKEKEG